MICELEHKILTIDNTAFDALALAVFRFQYEHNEVYRQYTSLLRIDPDKVKAVTQIPFLPIEFFKTHQITTTPFQPEIVFESSGTTDSTRGRHFVKDLNLYRQNFLKGFRLFYGPIEDYCILGLLPSYLERKNSSLVVMVDELIRQSKHPQSGFYLYEHEKLSALLDKVERTQQKTLLIGVTFALLDFAEKYSRPLQHTIIMETGGMKGRRTEMTRDEVHDILKNAWSLKSVHSEYGMTELLSQAYSAGAGLFQPPPWMKILIRDEADPLHVQPAGRGVINAIDLGNIYSCSFIATDDMGLIRSDGIFEVLGRRDNSDLRGCSLMAANP